MRLMVVGSGGREHVLAWKLLEARDSGERRVSSRIDKLFVAPGNGGTTAIAENVPIAADDVPALVSFADAKRIDLTIVGPEAPLVGGLVDAFDAAGLRAFGPTAVAAQLEGSKAFAKRFPERFFNMGISEQDLIGTAAGMSLAGKIVFASSFAIFVTGRCWE